MSETSLSISTHEVSNNQFYNWLKHHEKSRKVVDGQNWRILMECTVVGQSGIVLNGILLLLLGNMSPFSRGGSQILVVYVPHVLSVNYIL